MPYTLTLLCTGFVEIWLLLLPLALFGDKDMDPWHVGLEVLLYALISILLLSIDEAATQLEQVGASF